MISNFNTHEHDYQANNFPADCADKRRKTICENQRYLRETNFKQMKNTSLNNKNHEM